MLNVYFDLQNYADSHDGLFPYSSKGPLSGLRMLYPDYSNGIELAGLTGNVASTLEVLHAGGELTGNISSWIYIQGLSTNDDGKLAILWESKAGILPNGARDPQGGRAVLFLNGDRAQISPAEWVHFLSEQERMRKLMKAKKGKK